MTPPDTSALAARLVTVLGPTLVSTLAGSKDHRAAISWVEVDAIRPDANQVRRLECAEDVWLKVSGAEGDDVARQWFVGANPFLRNDTVIMAIREGRSGEVVAAAQAVIDDSFAG